jgi:hypothetical protein
MEKKQTAVQWLISQLALVNNSPFEAIAFYHDNKDLIEKAKEMEKEQICNAYRTLINVHRNSDEITNSDVFYAEQYYNETYL